MQSAWKVGLFVILFGVLIVMGYKLVGNSLFKKNADIYYGTFDDTGGIEPGAILTMVGVKVGTVTDVMLKSPKEAKMKLEITKGTFIPADAVLSVPSNLFSLGEQRMEISSAKGYDAGKLPVGSTLRGVKGSFLKTMLPEADVTIRELNETLKATRGLLGDQGIRNRLKNVLDGTAKTIGTLNLVLQDTRGFIAQNKTTIRQAVLNASAAIQDLRSGIHAVTDQLAGQDLKGNVKSILGSLNATAARAEELITEMKNFVGDPTLRTSLNNTMANMETMSRTGIDIAENTKAMTADGKVVTQKAIELADTAKEIATEAKSLLARLNEFVGHLPGSVKLPQPGFTLETGRNFDTKLFQTDIFIRYPLSPNSAIFAGVYDATEANLLTAQYQQQFGKNAVRYGIYAAKPGIGVDLQPSPKLSLTGDLFDPNDVKFNLRARFLFGNDLYGYIGLNRVFDKNQPIIGIGVKR